MNHIVPRLFLALLAGSSTLRGAEIPLPGDAARLPAFGGTNFSSVAHGGTGYLVVWEDTRATLSGSINTAYEPLMGNQIDIFGMRLDSNGQPLDAEPIAICTLGRNQTKPRVAWNGQSWLVVFTSERPDWYFFEDIMGVRVDANGTVLDPTPFMIRAEQNSPSNYYGTNASVSSDGVNWVVVWEDWNPANFRPNVKASRVAASGTVLDPNWVTLYEYNFPSFGPRDPQITFANGEYLLIWRDATATPTSGRRISTTLQPLAAPFTITTLGAPSRPVLATDGNQHYVIVNQKLFRVTSTGSVLDPSGITIPTHTTSFQPPHAAWNGQSLSIVQPTIPNPTLGNDVDLFLTRVNAAGQLLTPTPQIVTTHSDDEWAVSVAGDSGATQISFVALAKDFSHFEDFRSVHVNAAGVASTPVAVDSGLATQQNVRAITAPFGHLVTYSSKSSNGRRFLAQRLDASGNPLDAEPIEIASWPANVWMVGGSACNGTTFLLCWNTIGGATMVRRYDLSLAPIDPQPIQVFAGSSGWPAVGAVNGDFLVVSPYTISGDISPLRGARIRGSDGAILDPTPLPIAGSYVSEPDVDAIGGRFLVTWTRATTHDNPVTTVRGAFVDSNGTVAPFFDVSTSYYTASADTAVLGDEALIVYRTGSHGEDGIRAQRISATGTLLGSEITVSDDANGQMFPTVSARGSEYVVAWTDYRSTQPIEQLRGDIYASRVRADGVVLDPTGVAITSGSLPDELPDLSSNGPTELFFTAHVDGVAPRIVHRRLDDAFANEFAFVGSGKPGTYGVPALAGFGDLAPNSAVTFQIAGGKPSSLAFFFVGLVRVDLPLLGGVLVPSPDVLIALPLDGQGAVTLNATWPVGVPSGFKTWYQAWIQDPQAFGQASATSGLESTTP